MKVWHYENIVYVKHPEQCTAAVATAIIRDCRTHMNAVLGRYPKQAIYHDTAGMKTVDNAYLLAWAEVGKEYQAKSYYIVVVPNVWIRSLVKSVMFLGRFDIQTVKSHEEAAAALQKQGFTAHLNTEPA